MVELDDFDVEGWPDALASIACPGEGCNWETSFYAETLGDLVALAERHIEEGHPC